MPPHDSIENLQQAMTEGGDLAFDVVPMALKNVLDNRLWARRVDKHGMLFSSFESFAQHSLWEGLESSIDDLLAYCRKRPDVQRLIRREVEPEGGHGGKREPRKQGDNITLPERGTASTYTLKRLKRDRPDLFDRVVDGELSANAAAIKAGFRKHMITIPDPRDDIHAANRRLRKIGYRIVKDGTIDEAH